MQVTAGQHNIQVDIRALMISRFRNRGTTSSETLRRGATSWRPRPGQPRRQVGSSVPPPTSSSSETASTAPSQVRPDRHPRHRPTRRATYRPRCGSRLLPIPAESASTPHAQEVNGAPRTSPTTRQFACHPVANARTSSQPHHHQALAGRVSSSSTPQTGHPLPRPDWRRTNPLVRLIHFNYDDTDGGRTRVRDTMLVALILAAGALDQSRK